MGWVIYCNCLKMLLWVNDGFRLVSCFLLDVVMHLMRISKVDEHLNTHLKDHILLESP